MGGQKDRVANEYSAAYLHHEHGEAARRTQADELSDLEEIVGMRLSTAVRAYLEARRGELGTVTRKELRYTLSLFAQTAGRDMLARNLRRKHIEAWLGSIEDLAVSTRRQRLSAVKVFCRWCVISGHMKTDPTLGVKGPRMVMGIPRELARDDVQRLLAEVPDLRGRVILFLAVHELLRRAEIAGLMRQDIDLDGRLIFVHGKGGTEHYLPLSVESHAAINAYMGELPGRSGPLVRSKRRPGLGMTPAAVGDLMADWMKAAGIKQGPHDGKSLHALRHTGIGVILDSGGDVRDARDAARHLHLSTVDVYARKRRAQSRLRQVMGQETYGEKDNPTEAA